MKTKNPIWKIVLLISVILLVVSCQYFLKGCLWWNCVPQRPFHILDWELSEDMFPKDAYASSLTPSSEGAGEIERGSQVVYWNEDSSSAGYDIKRYPTIKDAIREYEYQFRERSKKKLEIGWETLNEFVYKSKTADEQLIVCYQHIEKSCSMVSRYQEYVIRFSSTIDDNMGLSDFERVLIYLDEQISSRLYP